MLVYLCISAFCIIFDKVYALFGHGVYSASMSLMFLYPLVGGVIVFLLLWIFKADADKVTKYRLNYNLYNSGISVLVIGSALKGVFDIAGTSSPYTIIYMICGSLFIAIGVINYWRNERKQKKFTRT